MKMKKAIVVLAVILLSSFSVKITQNKVDADTFPFVMPSKNFNITVLEYNSTIIEHEGIKYLDLSMAIGSLPMGIIYHSSNKNVVYLALYPNSSNPEWIYGIAEVDVTTKNLKIYRFPWQIDDNYKVPVPWTITVDKDNNLWISIRSYLVTPNQSPAEIPYLAKLNTETANLTIYYIPKEIGAGSDIKYYAEYVWYMTTNGLSKISLNGIIEEYYSRYFAQGFMETNSDSIWISSTTGDFITRFNLTSKLFDVNITGLNRPLGIEVDSGYVYVAENSRLEPEQEPFMGTIARISKLTLQIIDRINTTLVTNEGPYHVLKDSEGNLWWTDNSGHVGYKQGVYQEYYDSISPYCYFMTEVPEGSIWFSAKGSVHIGMIEIPTVTAKAYDFDGSGRIDGKDIIRVCKAYMSYPGHQRWDTICDVNCDGKIDGKDIIPVCKNFMKDP